MFLDAGAKLTQAQMSEIRHELAFRLLAPLGGDLVLPGEVDLTYRDAVVTDVAGWDTLFEDGSCEVEFTCFDAFAYGAEASCAGLSATVGGTADTCRWSR